MNRIIQCTTLVPYLGNQLFQYAFARAYAEYVEADLEFPEWFGERIFRDIPVNRPSCVLRKLTKEFVPTVDVNVDLHGHFQNQKALDYMSRKKILEWFQFKPEFDYLTGPETACHVRHGDFLKRPDIYCFITTKSYLKAMDKFGVPDIGVEWFTQRSMMPYAMDFCRMSRAKRLFRANSTFSWWAAVLNPNQDEIYSPVINGKLGWNDVEFVKGNHPRTIDTLPETHTDLCLPP